MQVTEAKQSEYRKPKLRESVPSDDIGLSHTWSMAVYCYNVDLKHDFEKVRTDYESQFQPLVLRWCALWLRYPANGVHLAVKVWKPFFAPCCELGVYSYYVIFSEGLRNFGFRYLRCIMSVSWISSAIAWRNIWCPNEFLWSPNPDNVCMCIFLL